MCCWTNMLKTQDCIIRRQVALVVMSLQTQPGGNKITGYVLQCIDYRPMSSCVQYIPSYQFTKPSKLIAISCSIHSKCLYTTVCECGTLNYRFASYANCRVWLARGRLLWKFTLGGLQPGGWV